MKTALKNGSSKLTIQKKSIGTEGANKRLVGKKKTVFDVKAMSYSFHLHPFDGQFTGNYQSKAWILQA